MDHLASDNIRMKAIRHRVVAILQSQFLYHEHESVRLFDEYHFKFAGSRGWSDADYYDHESAQGIALEVVFLHKFGCLDRQKFLIWRRDFYASTAK